MIVLLQLNISFLDIGLKTKQIDSEDIMDLE